jgi:hypothetical protein
MSISAWFEGLELLMCGSKYLKTKSVRSADHEMRGEDE